MRKTNRNDWIVKKKNKKNKDEDSPHISNFQIAAQFEPQRCTIIVLQQTSRLNLRKRDGEWIDANTRIEHVNAVVV